MIKSTKGITLIWSRDGRRYAYAKEGNLFAGSVDDKDARQLTGSKEEKSETAKDEAAKSDDRKKEKERFSAVRLSAKGDWLVASNKEGLWLLDTAGSSCPASQSWLGSSKPSNARNKAAKGSRRASGCPVISIEDSGSYRARRASNLPVVGVPVCTSVRRVVREELKKVAPKPPRRKGA